LWTCPPNNRLISKLASSAKIRKSWYMGKRENGLGLKTKKELLK
jgi:hypothetical protein